MSTWSYKSRIDMLDMLKPDPKSVFIDSSIFVSIHSLKPQNLESSDNENWEAKRRASPWTVQILNMTSRHITTFKKNPKVMRWICQWIYINIHLMIETPSQIWAVHRPYECDGDCKNLSPTPELVPGKNPISPIEYWTPHFYDATGVVLSSTKLWFMVFDIRWKGWYPMNIPWISQ